MTQKLLCVFTIAFSGKRFEEMLYISHQGERGNNITVIMQTINSYYTKALFYYFKLMHTIMPVPVAARSKAWVYGRSPAAIVGSNPTRCMDVCLL